MMNQPDSGSVTPADPQLQVVATSGFEDLPRAALALETALAAVASGLRVDVFLVLEASKWACEPRRRTGGRIYELLDQLEAMGVRVTCCSACVTEHCDPSKWRTVAGQAVVEAREGAVVSTSSNVTATVNATMQLRGLTAFIEGVVRGIPTVTI